MLETIEFAGDIYPALQAKGFASQWAIPFAKEVIKPEGKRGLDIGCNRPEWAFPGAIPIDPVLTPEYDATNLPGGFFDYIFSSHCLEHLDDYVGALNYWRTKLVDGGILFLYLPSHHQKYWWPHNNRKHRHVFFPEVIHKILRDTGWKNVITTGHDLNYSFYVVAEK